VTTSGSRRTQRYRERQRDGVVALSIAIDLVALSEWLIDTGHLKPWDCTNRKRVREALEQAVALWSRT